MRRWDERSFRKPWIQGTEEPLLRPHSDSLVTGTRCLYLMCYTLASRKFLHVDPMEGNFPREKKKTKTNPVGP